jgi:hypothetical protein
MEMVILMDKIGGVTSFIIYCIILVIMWPIALLALIGEE